MAASARFYETDDTTLATGLAFGNVPPGDSYFGRNGAYIEKRVKNDGTEALASVHVEIHQAGTYALFQYAQLAAGAGTPGAFQDHTANPLSLGGLAVGAAATVWADLIVPAGATPASAQKGNLVLLATT